MKASKSIFGFILFLLLISCNGRKVGFDAYSKSLYKPEYASGFEVFGAEGMESIIIETRNPWQGAENAATYLFIARGKEKAPEGFEGQILNGEAERIVCMSSSHIAMLDAIGEVERLVGGSGIDYVSNQYVTIHKDTIAEIGYEGNIDYEKLVALNPDLVLLYGINGASLMEGKLKELEIPFVYIGEYLEESPLGKAEWLVAVSEMIGKREIGEQIFAPLALRYNTLKEKIALTTIDTPTVMLNAPYGDSWLMAPAGSYVAQLITDAGGNYVYQENTSNVSKPIDLEEAYRLSAVADVWINVGGANSLADFKTMLPKFVDIPCVKNERVYNNTLRLNASGGNDYWESGVINPDLVLRDLVKIFHPELVKDDFVYYKQLK